MTAGQIYYARDCDRSSLTDKRLAVVGFGSQGRAFALNLRDSGCEVSVILREKSPNRESARSEGLSVLAESEAGSFDIIILAIPDHAQMGFYRECLQNTGGRRRTIVLLHGLNFHFENIRFSEREDVILLAPHGPGVDLRRLYVEGRGLSCFFAVGQNPSGNAEETGLALADAVGCSRAGIHETTFAEETIGDLFGEQALLVGGLAGLTDAVMETMVNSGLPEKNVRLETVAQLRLLAAMIEHHGPAGMIQRVSRTAGLGALEAIPKLFDRSFKKKLAQLYAGIESGEFNRNLLADAVSDFTRFNELLEEFRNRPSQKVSDENTE